MDVLFRDMRILKAGTQMIKVLYILKTALTVGIIVFSALETYTALRGKSNALPSA